MTPIDVFWKLQKSSKWSENRGYWFSNVKTSYQYLKIPETDLNIQISNFSKTLGKPHIAT